MHKLTIQLYSSVLLTLLIMGCFKGPGIGKQTTKGNGLFIAGTTDEFGVTTGDISSASGIAQTLTSSADGILGASVTFEPGSLAIDMSVSIEQGSNIADDSLASSLGFDNAGVSSASNALVVSGNANIDADQPFTLKLPLSSLGLALTAGNEYLVIFYRIKKNSENGETFNGIIPTSQIRIENGKAVFQIKYFGSFQAAYIANEVTEMKEQKTTATILTKKAESALPPIVWSDLIGSFSTSGGLIFKGNLAGLQSPIQCRFFADANQAAPWDHVCSGLSQPLFQTVMNDDTDDENCTDDETQTSGDEVLYGRFICEDSSGRVAVSPWTNKVTIPGGPNGGGGGGSSLPTVNGLSAIEITSGYIELQWNVDVARVGEIGGFYITYHNSNVPPINCNTNTYSLYHYVDGLAINPAGEVNFRLMDLDPNKVYSYRVCTASTDGNSSSPGATGTETTSTPAVTCNAGSLDGIGASACVINTTNRTIANGAVITGRGTLIIDSVAIQNLNPLESFKIVMGTDVIVRNGGFIKGNLEELSAEIIDLGVTGAGTIYADGLGYTGGAVSTQGNSPLGMLSAQLAGANGGGGSHGGLGFNNQSPPAQSYGDFEFPKDAGGGGAGSTTFAGGNGGGFIHIDARDSLNLGSVGLITASGKCNGNNGTSGCGAGGSILIRAENLSTTAGFSIEAISPTASSSSGQAGGGGRIAIHYGSASITNAILNQIKAHGSDNPSSRLQAGGAGTVFISSFDDPNNTSMLIFDNGHTETGNGNYDFGMPTLFNLMRSLPFTLNEVIVKNGAKVKPEYPGFDYANSVQTLTINNLEVLDYVSTVSGLGKISNTGFGGLGGLVATAGQGNHPGLSNGTNPGGGGGNYGAGGSGSTGVAGGSADTGAVLAPITNGQFISIGSGGGGGAAHKGGNGGGLVFIKVENNLTINGYIEANGTSDTGVDGGGGSGGFIYLKASNIELGANSAIKVKGGDGGTGGGGGGGGGYILLDYQTTSGSGAVSTNSYINGGVGTSGGNNGSSGFTQCYTNGNVTCP